MLFFFIYLSILCHSVKRCSFYKLTRPRVFTTPVLTVLRRLLVSIDRYFHNVAFFCKQLEMPRVAKYSPTAPFMMMIFIYFFRSTEVFIAWAVRSRHLFSKSAYGHENFSLNRSGMSHECSFHSGTMSMSRSFIGSFRNQYHFPPYISAYFSHGKDNPVGLLIFDIDSSMKNDLNNSVRTVTEEYYNIFWEYDIQDDLFNNVKFSS